jgi:hypothetical protein
VDVPLQDMSDGLGDVGIIPRLTGQANLDVVDDCLDTLDPLSRPSSGQLVGVAAGMPGQSHRTV